LKFKISQTFSTRIDFRKRRMAYERQRNVMSVSKQERQVILAHIVYTAY